MSEPFTTQNKPSSENTESSEKINQNLRHEIIQLIPQLIRTPLWHEKNGSQMHARVWKFELHQKSYALKITLPKSNQAASCLCREHEFLKHLNHPNIAHYIWHGVIDHRFYGIVTEWLEGQLLFEIQDCLHSIFADVKSLEQFCHQLKAIANHIHTNGVHHRDLWAKNIIVHQQQPYLFDFGWATWSNEEAFTPPQLQEADDSIALQQLIEGLLVAFNDDFQEA